MRNVWNVFEMWALIYLLAGDAAADDAWELRLSLEAKDASIKDLTRKNEELEDQLVSSHDSPPSMNR